LKIDNCEFPEDVYFDLENDTWLKMLSDNSARIGITGILSFLAGPVQKISLRKELSQVERGRSLGTIESNRYFGAIRSPVDGRIIRYNPELESLPRLVNDSPYEKGWVVEVKPAGAFQFARGREAEKGLEARIRELKVRCFTRIPDEEMFAIGVECSATLANLNQALANAPVGRVVHIVTDDLTSDIEMIRWASQTENALLETRREGTLFHFLVEKKHN
jgi:glycine cleavage system H protein